MKRKRIMVLPNPRERIIERRITIRRMTRRSLRSPRRRKRNLWSPRRKRRSLWSPRRRKKQRINDLSIFPLFFFKFLKQNKKKIFILYICSIHQSSLFVNLINYFLGASVSIGLIAPTLFNNFCNSPDSYI